MSAPTVSDQKTKIWANSGDSHYLEPDDLWYDLLPKELADRMPRAEKISETITAGMLMKLLNETETAVKSEAAG